jgi:hypothetical protein
MASAVAAVVAAAMREGRPTRTARAARVVGQDTEAWMEPAKEGAVLAMVVAAAVPVERRAGVEDGRSLGAWTGGTRPPKAAR